MSLLIEDEISKSLINNIQNIHSHELLTIASIIINYTYPERFLLFIRDIYDLVLHFKYPQSILDITPPENGVYILEYYMTNITDKQYTIHYRLIQLESVVDNSFHRIDYVLFHSDFTNKILSWMIN